MPVLQRLNQGIRRLPWVAAVVVSVLLTLTLLLLHANATVAATVYLVFVVWFATLAGVTLSLLLAVGCSFFFDYYFLEPTHSVAISGTESWVNLLSFIFACLVVSRVAETARLQTRQAERRREDVENLNILSQEMMLHEDAQGLVRDIPRLVEQVFGLDAVLLYVREENHTYSSVPGDSIAGDAASLSLKPVDQPPLVGGEGSISEGLDLPGDFSPVELVFGMKNVGTLAWKPRKLSREVATSVAAQVAIAITRAHAIEVTSRLEAARSADKLRSALVESLTHELRTPLTAIRAAATTLMGENGPEVGSDRGPQSFLDLETQSELISIIDEESVRLDELIGEAMEMAEIDSDGIRIRAEPLHTRTFLEQAVEQMRQQLAGHKVTIVVDDPETPVWFDPHLIGRVAHHLLENAARYTPAGGRIVLRSRRVLGRIQFDVEDDGPGIAPGDLPLIFDRFYRGKHRNIAGKGSGMGLAICRSIVTAHGGEIDAESQFGHGSTFRFWLPVVQGVGKRE